jgi:hypothetical protein
VRRLLPTACAPWNLARIVVLCVMIPYNFVAVYRRFGGT